MAVGMYYKNKKISNSGESKFNGWTGGIDYKKDELVLYNNNMYRCLLDHTSTTSFEDDLIGGNWKLIIGNESYEEEITTPSKRWIIQHDMNEPKIYKCIMIHTSTNFNNDLLNWIELDSGYYKLLKSQYEYLSTNNLLEDKIYLVLDDN